MSTTDERKFAFLGSGYPEIQKAILDFFIKLGASNKLQVEGKNVNLYYFIDATNKINNSRDLPEGYIFQLDTYLNVMKNKEDKIPEYVECIESRDDIFTVGKIYTWPAPVCNNRIIRQITTLDGLLWGFKPSTKEAYDAQNTYLKAAEYTPQVGDYVVMEKAGGWGYSPDNNGCVAIVSSVGKNRVGRAEVFSIWGEVINPNKPRNVNFGNIPQIGYGKEVIFRKALPHEIPGSNVKVEPQQQVEEPKESLTKEKGELERRTQYPITPENAFPVKALRKQLKIVKFQEVHEIKTVEEKLLKKTKSKLFNI